MKCDVVGCNYYSDCDVYFEDGSCKDMCSYHASRAGFKDNRVVQVVPQHGGEMNQPIKED